MKNESLLNKGQPINGKAQKLKKSQREQLEYIQGQIDKIRNLVEDRQLWWAWQTLNEVSGRKSTSRVKLKLLAKKKDFIIR